MANKSKVKIKDNTVIPSLDWVISINTRTKESRFVTYDTQQRENKFKWVRPIATREN